MKITKINSTGSFWKDKETGICYSYGTQLEFIYKGYYIQNRTFYSRTTSKHQGKLEYCRPEFCLHYIPIGTVTDNIEPYIKTEIEMLLKEHDKISPKYNTKKKKARIDAIVNHVWTLQQLLNK